ncbi:MAG TPA: MFS transporter [Aggregatilineaceae bacterium]|nr:MFS transporter [Aggregatilineaceae bacterium]
MIKRLPAVYPLLFTQIFSLIGSRMTGIAVGIHIFQDTGSTAPLLIAAFFAELPGMVGGTFTGLLADRWDRRHVIILGDAGQAVGTILLMISFLSGAFQLWHLYTMMLIQGIFGTIQSPASDAAITMLVPEARRDRINGIRSMGFPLAGVIAPVLAGALYSLVGVEGVMAFDLFTFAVAVLVVGLMTIPRPDTSEEAEAMQGQFWREMLGGWHYLVARRMLLWMVVYISFIYFLINGPLELAIPYMLSVSGSEKTLGILLGVMNLGALSGAAAIAILGRMPHRIDVILLGFFALGWVFLLYGVARHPVLLGMAAFLVLFPLPLIGTLFTTFLQNKTPADLQGRMFAITGQMFMLATPFSFLITAALVDKVLEPAVHRSTWKVFVPLVGREDGAGMGLLLIVIGLIIIVTTALFAFIPGIRRLEKDLPSY